MAGRFWPHSASSVRSGNLTHFRVSLRTANAWCSPLTTTGAHRRAKPAGRGEVECQCRKRRYPCMVSGGPRYDDCRTILLYRLGRARSCRRGRPIKTNDGVKSQPSPSETFPSNHINVHCGAVPLNSASVGARPPAMPSPGPHAGIRTQKSAAAAPQP